MLTILADNHSTADLLLEFVPNDDPALVHREATTLRSIAEAAGYPATAGYPTAALAP